MEGLCLELKFYMLNSGIQLQTCWIAILHLRQFGAVL